jgi:hypothetical protein
MSGPAIDPSDMSSNQALFFGVHGVNVSAQAHDIENAVRVTPPTVIPDATVLNAFVKDAPNLPFKWPWQKEPT